MDGDPENTPGIENPHSEDEEGGHPGRWDLIGGMRRRRWQQATVGPEHHRGEEGAEGEGGVREGRPGGPHRRRGTAAGPEGGGGANPEAGGDRCGAQARARARQRPPQARRPRAAAAGHPPCAPET